MTNSSAAEKLEATIAVANGLLWFGPRRLWLPLLTTLIASPAATAVRAMDFEYKQSSDKLNPVVRLHLSGEIRSGDADRLRHFLHANATRFMSDRTVELDSPGGNLDEALQIAQVLREVMARAVLFSSDRCASACFFLYVAAPTRASYADQGAGLAVHRPYFATERTRQMRPDQAEAAQTAAYARAKQWLQERLVSQALIDKMLSLPSTDAYWLTEHDVVALGYQAAWYEEWLNGQCPGYLEAQQRWRSGKEGTAEDDAAFAVYRELGRCADAAPLEEVRGALRRYGAPAAQIGG